MNQGDLLNNMFIVRLDLCSVLRLVRLSCRSLPFSVRVSDSISSTNLDLRFVCRCYLFAFDVFTVMTTSLTLDGHGIKCDDLAPGNYNHIKERVGSQWSDQDKGDEDSVKQRQRTVETLGVRPELRNPRWRVQHATLGVDDEFLSIHWGTLFDATKRAWQSDTAKTNRVVQVTLATPIRGARLYKRDLPPDAAKFLVDNGNLLNKESTSTSILETWRSTRTIEGAFQRKRR